MVYVIDLCDEIFFIHVEIMKYNYADLSFIQFEDLAIFICHHLLGSAVKGFATGRDGGRDAKFIGTAQDYPSTSNPWRGTTIIQAKHTCGYNQSFSDPDFFSLDNENSIILKEIERVRKLKESDELNQYMLFSNRRLTALADSRILEYISQNAGIPIESIGLFGIEQIENLIKRYPKIVEMADIDPIDCPLMVSPHELAEVIEALAAIEEKDKQHTVILAIERTSFAEKNKLNDMPEDYAEILLKKCLKETHPIRQFLAAPENKRYIDLYMNIIEEFQFKIIAHKKDYQTFDKLMEYMIDLLFQRDPVLARNKKLTRLMLFYMYWNCDIGKNNHA